MGIKKSYAVFGLGKYGVSVAKELVRNGAEVLAVDKCEAAVNAASPFIPLCKCADVTDEEVIRQLGIANIDVVIISMADSFEASVLATTLCKEAGVKHIIVKCSNEMHSKILLNIGASEIVFPESESGIRTAKNLLSAGFVDIIELSKDASMLELDMKEDWIGKPLIALDLRKKYGINVVAIKQNGNISTYIDPEMPLSTDMKLIIIANPGKLGKLR